MLNEQQAMMGMREARLRQINSLARSYQQLFANHRATADEIIARQHNDRLITLLDEIERLRAALGTIKKCHEPASQSWQMEAEAMFNIANKALGL